MTTKIPVELSSTPGIVDGSNATAITIDSSERVGIGTASPAYLLHLQASTDTDLNIISGTSSGDFGSILFGDTDYPAEGRITYQNSDNAMRFWTNRSQAMMINSSGNVGIGTTSPAQTLHTSGTGVQRIQIDATDNNAAGAGLYMKVLNSGSLVGNATVRVDNVGNIDFFNGTSSDSQKMTILADGKVGIGTASPAVDLEISSSQPNINLTDSDNARIAQLSGSAGDLYLRADTGNGAGSSKIIFEVDGGEKIRVDSDGRTGFGTTTTGNGKLTVQETSSGSSAIMALNNVGTANSSTTPLVYCQFNGDSSVGTGTRFVTFANSNDFIGSITGAPSSVAYNTSSDRNLKENIVDASSQLDIIKAIQVREYDWKIDSHHDLGVIAQELYEVIPNVVTEGIESDDNGRSMPWTVDYGRLTPYLIKAIQEQQEQIEQLKTEIQTLKGE